MSNNDQQLMKFSLTHTNLRFYMFATQYLKHNMNMNVSDAMKIEKILSLKNPGKYYTTSH